MNADVLALDPAVALYLKDVLTLVLENRPENPQLFMAEYFKSALGGAPPSARALWYLRLCPVGRPAFVDNLVAAFNTVDRGTAVTPGAATDSAAAGRLTGAAFLVLLRGLLVDVPEEPAGEVLAALAPAGGPDEAVPFSEFARAARACILLSTALGDAAHVFRDHGDRGGRVPRTTLQAALKHLADLVLDPGGAPLTARAVADALEARTTAVGTESLS